MIVETEKQRKALQAAAESGRQEGVRECGDSNILYSLVISKGRRERYQGEMGEVSLLQAAFHDLFWSLLSVP